MKKIQITALALMGLLFFIWPVPHTVSARDLLLLLNLAVFAWLAWRTERWPGGALREFSVPLALLAALTAWMYFVAFFISPETGWTLDELSSQWLRALLALLIGALVATVARDDARFTRRVLAVLVAVLLLHILYVDLEAMKEVLKPGPYLRASGLTEGPDKSNYLTNVLFAFLLAELFFRVTYRRQVLSLARAAFAAALVLAAASVFAEGTRNGMITLVLMLLLVAWFYLRQQREHLNTLAVFAGAAAMLAIVLGGAAMVVSARQSSSLNKLVDSIAIGWDTEHHHEWLDNGRHGWPKLPDGEPVDDSVYARVAWFKEGLMLVRDHPLGIGFGRDAFGHGLKAKYGQGAGHTHSGLLDLAIGTGIPGILLWLGFFAGLMRLAWKRHRRAPNYAALLLVLISLDYGVRMILDSVIRDHMLQQFMFLAGLAAVMMLTDGDQADRQARS